MPSEIGNMRFRIMRKEGMIFAAGVMCGFFIRSLMAKGDSPTSNEDIVNEHWNSVEDVLLSVKQKLNDWASTPASEQKGDEDFLPECFMKVPEIIRYSGYPFEQHTVTTVDGYNLGVHRIPHGIKEKDGDKRDYKKPAVLLQHGLLADSANWVSNGPEHSLAFLLAEYGLDVWLGNVRGNTYSRSHTHLDPDVDEKFWRYSWQQFSEIDLPAMVDYVREKTGNKKVYYIGHSQGTLIMFAKLASDKDFNDKIHMFMALGPVFSLKYMRSPIRHFASLYKTLETGQWMMGGAELLPNSEAGKWMSTKLHQWMETHHDFRFFGGNLLLALAGFNPERYFKKRLPVYLSHTPAGTSIQNIIHFAQMIAHNDTCKYRFGSDEENTAAYSSGTPPSYDLSAIQTPVALFWGSNDWFADSDDVLSIIPELKTLIRTKEYKEWDHLEFLFGEEASSTLYKELAKLIKANEEKIKNIHHTDL